jgi:hypothetical protein
MIRKLFPCMKSIVPAGRQTAARRSGPKAWKKEAEGTTEIEVATNEGPAG